MKKAENAGSGWDMPALALEQRTAAVCMSRKSLRRYVPEDNSAHIQHLSSAHGPRSYSAHHSSLAASSDVDGLHCSL